MSDDGIVRSSAKVSAVKLVGSLAGLLAVLVVAHRYGSTAQTDAYFIGRILPVILATQLARAFSIALVPVFGRIQEDAGIAESRRVTGATMTCMAVLLLVGTVVLLALLWPLLQVQAPGFSEAQRQEAWGIALILLPLITLLGVGSIIEAFLNVNRVFLPSELGTNLLSIGTLTGALLLAPYLGIEGIAIGTTAGTAIGFLLVLAYAFRRHGLRPIWCLATGKTVLVRSFKSIASVFSGVSAGQIVILFAQGAATTLGDGATSIFNYAMRLVTGFPLVVGMAVGKVLMPRLVQKANLRDSEQMRGAVATYLRGICLVFAPYAVLFFLYRDVLIRLLFPSDLLSSADLWMLSATLAAYAPAIFLGSVNNILIRTFHSIGHPTVIIRTASIYMVAGLVSIYLFCRWFEFGVAGLALAMTVAFGAQTAALCGWLIGRIGSFLDRKFGDYLIRLTAALALAVLPVVVLLPPNVFTEPFLQVAISSIASALVFLTLFIAVLSLFRLPEIRALRKGFRGGKRS